MRDGAVKLAAAGLSAALHGALLAGLYAAPLPAQSRQEVVTVEIESAPPRAPEPPRPDPTPPPRVAAARPLTVPRPAPPDAAPPPPNQPPPAEAPPPGPRAPLRVGVSMSATAEGGGFAAPVGNTLYGKPPEQAPDPAEVKPYRAERYTPPTAVSRMPVPLETTIPPSEYPEEARQLGVEGPVRLRLQVDADGRVVAAEVLSDPGHGLGLAAARNARERFRFRPALRDGQPVATELVFVVRWELP